MAETLTQECFLRAYRNRLNFRGESSVRTWLIRIAINLRTDHWRDRRIRFWREAQTNAVDVEAAGELLPSAERSPEAQVIAREQLKQISKVVQGLSRRERSVFLLRYFDELELSQIGERTGLKVATAKLYLARARTKVRASFEKSNKYGNNIQIPRSRPR